MKLLYGPMRRIGMECGQMAVGGQGPWPYRSTLDEFLAAALPAVPHCKYLYILDRQGVQISSSMSRDGLITEHFGRDRSDRPYMREALSVASFMDKNHETFYQQWPYLEENLQAVDFLLCDAYISQNALRPSITAVYFIRDSQGNHVGFVGADFALRELPQSQDIYEEIRRPRHFSGVFESPGSAAERAARRSKLDRNIDTVMSVVEELIAYHGVYHVKLHFSSSQTVVWQLDDPYRYRLLTVEDLIDPGSCLAYPRRPYPESALITQEEIRQILERMKRLRQSDNPICLRSGSVNIFNGMVGISFSSDGSHYIPHDEFLMTDLSLWAM